MKLSEQQRQRLEDAFFTRVVIDKLTPSGLAQLAAKYGLVLVPLEPNKLGVAALDIAVQLKGHWQKQKGERDTEKVKRIYKIMIEAGKVK